MNIITPKTLAGLLPCANGYILLISVVILGAIATSIAVALLFLGVGDSKNAISFQQSERAKAAVNGCAEEILEQIRENSSFAGSGNLAISGNSCDYTIINTGGETRSITVSSTASSVTRRASITITALNPQIVATWQETP